MGCFISIAVDMATIIGHELDVDVGVVGVLSLRAVRKDLLIGRGGWKTGSKSGLVRTLGHGGGMLLV